MQIRENVLLAPFTTFKAGGEARYFDEVTNTDDLEKAVLFARERNAPIFILGGGSNILVSDNGFYGLAIKISLRGIRRENENDLARVIVSAGEAWDDFVEYAVSNGLHGLENLSGIPGSVGAAPIQNIGAYGVEAGDLIENVSALDSETGAVKNFSGEECDFSYRGSFFKTGAGKKFVILSVTFLLKLKAPLSLGYRGISDYFKDRGIREKDASIKDTRAAVLAIRQSKLPPLEKFGTAGSFFKNPVVSLEKLNDLLRVFPDTPYFTEENGVVKIPAAYLIEKSGFKGTRRGDAGVYDKHALVLVNLGGAKSADIYALAGEIRCGVFEKTGILLESEVNLVGEFGDGL